MTYILMALLMIRSLQVHSLSIHRTCTYFPHYRNNSQMSDFLCDQFVKYKFLLHSHETIDDLDRLAVQYYDQFRNESVNAVMCDESIRILSCSRVFLKCENNVSMSDRSTWSNTIYGEVGEDIQLPFQRPCRSVCTNALSRCSRVLPSVESRIDCDERYDYESLLNNTAMDKMIFVNDTSAYPHRYDTNDVESICNREVMIQSWPSCPRGFVFPEDADDIDVRWVTGTPCAEKCM
jgi:hypothetical protein